MGHAEVGSGSQFEFVESLQMLKFSANPTSLMAVFLLKPDEIEQLDFERTDQHDQVGVVENLTHQFF